MSTQESSEKPVRTFEMAAASIRDTRGVHLDAQWRIRSKRLNARNGIDISYKRGELGL